VCIAVPGVVLELYQDRGASRAGVDFQGARREVNVEFVPEAQVGDWVLVHLGMAIQCLDEREARETLSLFEEAGLLQGTPLQETEPLEGDVVPIPAQP
jgi:hydrogenase expression/formation protein HypC